MTCRVTCRQEAWSRPTQQLHRGSEPSESALVTIARRARARSGMRVGVTVITATLVRGREYSVSKGTGTIVYVVVVMGEQIHLGSCLPLSATRTCVGTVPEGPRTGNATDTRMFVY